MMIYLMVLIVLCFASAMSVTRPDIHRAIYWFALTFLFFFTAYRFQVGCDWTGYLNLFHLAKTTDWRLLVNSFDPGFMLMNKLVVELGLPYTYVNVFSAVLFFGGIHALARLQPNRLAFLLFTYPVMILNLPMSALRQGIAVGFLCLAFTFFIKNRKIYFALTILLASSFHSSAAFFIVLTPLAGKPVTRSRLALLLVLMLVVIVFLVGRPVGQQAVDRYIDASVQSSGAIFRILYLAVPCIFFLVFLRQGWKSRSPEDYSLVLLSSTLFFLAAATILVSSTVADRLAYYFYPAQAIILAKLPMFFEGKTKSFVVAGSYLLMFVFFFFWVAFSGLFNQCYVPYDFGIYEAPSVSTF